VSRPRRHQARHQEYSSPDWQAVGRCPACGKKCYTSKKAAKQAAKVHHSDDHLSPYQCRSDKASKPNPAPWHLGHLDGRIMTGEVTRVQVYEQRATNYLRDETALEAIQRVARASQK
jgi:hypothetical protein